MKKRDLMNRIADMAKASDAEFVRNGGSKHDKYKLNGKSIMIPRHNEIGETLAAKIIKQAEEALE